MKIMICTIDSIVVYKLADYVSGLFPDAEYYLVSLIEHLKRRILLTKIYKSTLEKTLDKAQKNVENIMRKKGVKNIHRHIIHDNWRHFLNKFVKKYGIDMIAISSRTAAELGTIGSTTEKVIRLANVPVLLYTPSSEIYPLTSSIKILVINGAKIPDNIRDLLSKKYKVEVEEKALEDLEGERITNYDLVVTSKDTLLKKKIYKKIWAPFIIVP